MTKLSAIISFAAVVTMSVTGISASHIRADRRLDDSSSGSNDVNSWDEGSGSSPSSQFADVDAWEQCGGANFDYSSFVVDDASVDADTKLDCEAGYTCAVVNPVFFQCQPLPDADTVPKYGQCGGIGYAGSTDCASGLDCVISDPWFAQCLPEGSAEVPTTKKRSRLAKKSVEADVLIDELSDESDAAGSWEQCGGKNFDSSDLADASTIGDEVSVLPCKSGYTCNFVNEWYYQCQPLPGQYTLKLWEQCGGLDYEGESECNSAVCKYFSDWYSQCVPKEMEFS